MFIYLMIADWEHPWDKDSHMLVAAPGEEEARKFGDGEYWPTDPKDVSVRLLGTAPEGTEAGVILRVKGPG